MEFKEAGLTNSKWQKERLSTPKQACTDTIILLNLWELNQIDIKKTRDREKTCSCQYSPGSIRTSQKIQMTQVIS